MKNRTLYAHWTEGGSNNDATVETGLGKAVNYRRTTTEGINVYSYPDPEATVIDTLSAGTEVLIVEEYSSFGRINSSGWILLDSTKEVENNDHSISPVTVTVQNTEVNVRSGPGTNYSIVGSADKGDTMTLGYAVFKLPQLTEKTISLELPFVKTVKQVVACNVCGVLSEG